MILEISRIVHLPDELQNLARLWEAELHPGFHKDANPPVLHQFAQQHQLVTGQEIVWFDQLDGSVDVYGGQIPRTHFIMLNSRLELDALPAVAGHEYGHFLKEVGDTTYRKIDDIVGQSLSWHDARRLISQKRTCGYSEEEAHVEFVMDTIGDAYAATLNCPTFWQMDQILNVRAFTDVISELSSVINLN